MKLSRNIGACVALTAIVVIQTSCGDSSGPGNGAASIAANSSTNLAAAPGAPVGELPSVVVRNQNGQPVVGAHVTFAVQSGGGSITGGSATTDESGIATVGSWVLGPSTGTNTLTAKTGNLPAVIFTADAADPCSILNPHTLGTTTNGQLTQQDCRLSDGTLVDFYAVTIPAAGTYIFNQTSPTFDTFLAFLGPTGAVIGLNDDAPDVSKSTVKAILPAGNFVIAANSYEANATGNYSISSSASTAHITACEEVFTVRGVSTPQSLQSTDCTLNGVFGDQYVIVLFAGQPVNITMTSTSVDSYLEIRSASDPTLTILSANDDQDASTKDAKLVFTAASSDFYVVTARTPTTSPGMTGTYTLTIQ
jgi:hypothetical protein